MESETSRTPSWSFPVALLPIVGFLYVQFLFAFGLGIWASYIRFHMEPPDPQAIGVKLTTWLPVSDISAALVAWLIVWCIARARGGISLWRNLALDKFPTPWVVLSLGAVVLAWGLSYATTLIWPPPEIESFVVRLRNTGVWGWVWVGFSAVLLAPFLEEVLFRGLLFSALRKNLREMWAMGITSLLFLLLHLEQYSYPPGLVLLLLLAFALTWLRARSGSLWPAVLLHMGFNLPLLFI